MYVLEDIDGEVVGSGELSTRLEDTRFVLRQSYEGVPEDGRAAATDVTELAVDASTLAPFGALREAERENDDGATERDVYDWTELDQAVQLAEDNGFPFRFHVLLWGSQQPDWIEELPAAEQLEEIRQWFEAVSQR